MSNIVSLKRDSKYFYYVIQYHFKFLNVQKSNNINIYNITTPRKLSYFKFK